MQVSNLLLSYYEFSAEAVCRVGAGAPEEIIARCTHDPSVRICLRELTSVDSVVRLRLGSAMLTDHGLVLDPFEDKTEQKGAWVGTLSRAVQAMGLLTDTEQQAIASLPAECSTTWFLLNLASRRLTRVAGPEPYLITLDVAASEVLTEVLVRMSGSADVLRAILGGSSEAIGDNEDK